MGTKDASLDGLGEGAPKWRIEELNMGLNKGRENERLCFDFHAEEEDSSPLEKSFRLGEVKGVPKVGKMQFKNQ